MFEVSDRRQVRLVSTATEGLAGSYHHVNRVSPVYHRHPVLDGILNASAMSKKALFVNYNKCFVCVKRDPTVIDGTANLLKRPGDTHVLILIRHLFGNR